MTPRPFIIVTRCFHFARIGEHADVAVVLVPIARLANGDEMPPPSVSSLLLPTGKIQSERRCMYNHSQVADIRLFSC